MEPTDLYLEKLLASLKSVDAARQAQSEAFLDEIEQKANKQLDAISASAHKHSQDLIKQVREDIVTYHDNVTRAVKKAEESAIERHKILIKENTRIVAATLAAGVLSTRINLDYPTDSAVEYYTDILRKLS